MASLTDRLSARGVATLTKAGLYPDGMGLCLQVRGPNSKSWIYRYTLNGKARWLGLGSTRDVSLAQARIKRDECRIRVKAKQDPAELRQTAKAEKQAAAAASVTFRQRAEEYLSTHESGWKNPKHRQQWRNTLIEYVYPVFGEKPAASILPSDVAEALAPIWVTKRDTANRVRGRIESILDAACNPDDHAWRNPATLTPQLRKKLGKRPKRRKRHHPALPYAECPAFVARLQSHDDAISARALEFTILTAARTAETIGARWAEFNFRTATWTVPGERMKGGEEHAVPLSAPALRILRQMTAERRSDFVFPGSRADQGLSDMAMLALIRRMGVENATTHGFRSSFRDWVAEQTDFPPEVAEAALAHVVSDETVASYKRTDFFDRRRTLMAEWADYVSPPSRERNVIQFPA